MIEHKHIHAALLAEWGKDPRMAVRQAEPLNVETELAAHEGAVTPLALFFMRNNSTVPHIDADIWRLAVEGHVERPFVVDYAELRTLPTASYIAVLQCSGNGRARFAETGQKAEGVQWENGAVGNAEWVGVPVRTLLERAGVLPGAVQVECVAADAAGTTRGVEIAKLLDDALLAYAINGEPLPPAHGGPVRLIVPGWGGISSIKWIVALRVLDRESDSIYNREKYLLIDRDGNARGKVRELPVASVIANLKPGDRLPAGRTPVRGFAWAPRGIRRVDVSADGGTSWHAARLLADLGPRSWRQWEYAWDARPGGHVLAVRATDRSGAAQPMDVLYNQQGYLMNAVQCVTVTIC